MRFGRRARVAFRPQSAATDCGLACLQMVLAYHGRHLAAAELRRTLRPTRDGTTALALFRCARAHGLRAQGYAVSFDGLSALTTPAILHTTDAHFLVFEGVRGGRAVVVDTRVGRFYMTREQAAERLSGTALTFSRSPGFKQRGRLAMLRACGQAVLPGGRRIWATLALATVVVGLGLLAAAGMLARVAPDVWRAPPSATASRQLIAVLAVSAIAMLLLLPVKAALTIAVGGPVSRAVVSRLTGAEPGELLEGSPEVLFYRVLECDPLTSPSFPGAFSPVVVAGGIIAAGVGSCLPGFDAPLLWLSLLGSLTLAGVATWFSTYDEAGHLVYVEAAKGALRWAVEGTWVVRAPWGAPAAVSSWQHARALALRARAWIELRLGLIRAAHLGGSAAFVLALWSLHGSRSVATRAECGSAFLATLVVASVYPARSVLLATGHWLRRAELLADALTPEERVVETSPQRVAEEPPASRTGHVLRGVARQPSALRVAGVPTRDLQRTPCVPTPSLNFELADGERIVVVGPCGSGKTALASVLLGIRRPAAGTIFLNGRPFYEWSAKERATLVRGALQGDRIRNDSIDGILRLGGENVSPDYMRRVCEELGIHDDIMRLSLGYATPILGDGSTVSRGQRQLLLLAGALAPYALVTVLDDPLNSLDPAAARRALGAITRLTRALVVTATDAEEYAAAGYRVLRIGGARTEGSNCPEIPGGSILPGAR